MNPYQQPGQQPQLMPGMLVPVQFPMVTPMVPSPHINPHATPQQQQVFAMHPIPQQPFAQPMQPQMQMPQQGLRQQQQAPPGPAVHVAPQQQRTQAEPQAHDTSSSAFAAAVSKLRQLKVITESRDYRNFLESLRRDQAGNITTSADTKGRSLLASLSSFHGTLDERIREVLGMMTVNDLNRLVGRDLRLIKSDLCVELLESEYVSVNVFVLHSQPQVQAASRRQNEPTPTRLRYGLPLHDHRYMSVWMHVVSGAMQLSSFDFQRSADRKSAHRPLTAAEMQKYLAEESSSSAGGLPPTGPTFKKGHRAPPVRVHTLPPGAVRCHPVDTSRMISSNNRPVWLMTPKGGGEIHAISAAPMRSRRPSISKPQPSFENPSSNSTNASLSMGSNSASSVSSGIRGAHPAHRPDSAGRGTSPVSRGRNSPGSSHPSAGRGISPRAAGRGTSPHGERSSGNSSSDEDSWEPLIFIDVSTPPYASGTLNTSCGYFAELKVTENSNSDREEREREGSTGPAPSFIPIGHNSDEEAEAKAQAFVSVNDIDAMRSDEAQLLSLGSVGSASSQLNSTDSNGRSTRSSRRRQRRKLLEQTISLQSGSNNQLASLSKMTSVRWLAPIEQPDDLVLAQCQVLPAVKEALAAE